MQLEPNTNINSVAEMSIDDLVKTYNISKFEAETLKEVMNITKGMADKVSEFIETKKPIHADIVCAAATYFYQSMLLQTAEAYPNTYLQEVLRRNAVQAAMLGGAMVAGIGKNKERKVRESN